jgi:hypothetical protein
MRISTIAVTIQLTSAAQPLLLLLPLLQLPLWLLLCMLLLPLLQLHWLLLLLDHTTLLDIQAWYGLAYQHNHSARLSMYEQLSLARAVTAATVTAATVTAAAIYAAATATVLQPLWLLLLLLLLRIAR